MRCPSRMSFIPIYDIKTGDSEIKTIQYADDTTLLLYADTKRLKYINQFIYKLQDHFKLEN